MAYTQLYSLFDPVAVSHTSESVNSMVHLVVGDIAITLSTVAFAILGGMALAGALRLYRGAMITAGLFFALGAPGIASGLVKTVSKGAPNVPYEVASAPVPANREELPPANNSPYAKASIREDR